MPHPGEAKAPEAIRCRDMLQRADRHSGAPPHILDARKAPTVALFGDGPVHRSLQKRFDTRRLADNVEQRVVNALCSGGISVSRDRCVSLLRRNSACCSSISKSPTGCAFRALQASMIMIRSCKNTPRLSW